MNSISQYGKMKDSGIKWIGKVPGHWSLRLLKYMFSIKKDIAGSEGYTVLSVTQKGIVPKKMSDKGQFAKDYSKYQLVHVGDFVMNHMDLLTGWIDVSSFEGVTSPDYRVFTNDSPDIYESAYYKYIFQHCYQNRIFYGLGQGVSGFGRWRLPANMFLNFHLPVPPLSEQNAIAAYLDDQCEQIDSLVQEAKDCIEEYKKWRAAIIFEAVTKGLDSSAEMKNSGVEWIGMMPEHWIILSLKFLCDMQAGKNITANDIAENGEYPVYGGNGLRGYYSEYNRDGNYLLVGRQGALCGNVHRASGKFWATEHAVVTSTTENVNQGYLYYLLIAMNLNRYASAVAAQPGLSVNVIQNLKTIAPPLDEQKQIAKHLDEKCTTIDEIINEKESLITDLESYKKSLIYEVVTGKRKVVQS